MNLKLALALNLNLNLQRFTPSSEQIVRCGLEEVSSPHRLFTINDAGPCGKQCSIDTSDSGIAKKRGTERRGKNPTTGSEKSIYRIKRS